MSEFTPQKVKPKKPIAADRDKTLLWLIRALRKNWHIIIALSVLGMGSALFYSKSEKPVYQAMTLIEFDPDVIRPLGNKQDPMVGWSAIWDTREYYETQYRIMVSNRVMSAVVRDLALQSDAQFLGYRPKTPVSLEEASNRLRGKIVIDPVKGSRLVYIEVEDNDPALARRLSDAIARAYIAQNLEKTVSATSDTLVWLSGQLDHFKTELEQNENQLHDFKKRNELPSSTLDEVSKTIRQEMQDYDQALTRTRTRRAELSARHSELAKITVENPEEVPASELLQNAFLQQLRTLYQSGVRERRELIADGKGENHPSVRKADEKISQTRRDLLEEIKNIKGAVARDLAVIERQEAGESALYEGARKRAVELNLKELEYHRLDRMRAQNEKLYGVLLEQTKEADLRRMMNTNNIRLLDGAAEPTVPIRPKVLNTSVMGLLIGLLLGLGFTFLKEYLDRSIKTPEDLEEQLGTTFLGMLPEVAEDGEIETKKKRSRRGRSSRADEKPSELIVHERPLSGVAEAARTLRTNLMFMNPDSPHRVLLVTSAAPAEGKTTVACSIAISFAQGGQKVCILDCDLRRPRLHRIFGRVGDAGLTNVLLGDASLDEVAQLTEIPNLYCVPSGPIPPNPADILHSERFKEVLGGLLERFDRIVIDSPPVVAVTDATILSTIVDGLVFVVRAFSTRRALSIQGVRALRDVDAPILGAVLNAVDTRRHEYQYYTYYYYRKDYRYGPQAGGPPNPPASRPNVSA